MHIISNFYSDFLWAGESEHFLAAQKVNLLLKQINILI
jgi:hypothetical protein